MKLSLTVAVFIFGLMLSQQAFAGSCPCGMPKEAVMQIAKADVAQPTSQITEPVSAEVGNTICPISGKKVVPGKEAKVEYNGKVYNLCCSMCEKDFKKDPEAAIKKLEAAQTAK